MKDIDLGSTPEKDYRNRTTLEHRKGFAQFFTPLEIAIEMTNWIINHTSLSNVLEPAFGTGIFTRLLLLKNKKITIKGFEIDPQIFNFTQEYYKNIPKVNLILKDYMFNDWDNRYDGIVCNPPYLKFHDFDNIKVINEVAERLSIKLTGFTNLYTLFLIKSIYQLQTNGRAAYIIPSEFLNSDYGVQIKKYLIRSKTLRHIFIIDFEESVFDEALTTACILLLAKDNNYENVHFSSIHKLNDLSKISDTINSYPVINSDKTIKLTELDPEIKWRAYYQEQQSLKFNDLVPFSQYGKVVRGIATGANKYFTFNQTKTQQHGIPATNLLPCICKSNDVKSSFFTSDQFEELVLNNKTVFLFNAKQPQDENVKRYLELGERDSIPDVYLTSKRNPWYLIENRPPSPIWVSVFNRNGLRFIRNEANVSNLTTFHCIYPTSLSVNNLNLLFAYLLSSVSISIFNDNRREYGNGLQKFEPNDLNKGLMLNLAILDSQTIRRILEIYNNYREADIAGFPKEDCIEQLDRIFIENYT